MGVGERNLNVNQPLMTHARAHTDFWTTRQKCQVFETCEISHYPSYVQINNPCSVCVCVLHYSFIYTIYSQKAKNKCVKLISVDTKPLLYSREHSFSTWTS